MQVRAICNKCGKNIYLNIQPEHLNETKGGIFRAATQHNCNGENRILLLYIDENLSVRGVENAPLVTSEEK
ncbi:MAG: hypothetical protein OdinLCB4_007505 [Candidatus Odinarchaeum yellowstonii]|uniref:Uncharacterized protein n=1 Tax=Odinarchaeota yellowstonii (strain LCB_4) TaxID=1841599 RepID=A0AAF0D251_ODILC|nr:MAG: hypothetical protein OdinLCB4_007505 [Candidatus Odinarchaeum yellowstonii]